MTLREYLPQFIAEEKYTKEVLDAIEPEIDKIKIQISKILFECCVSTCFDEGMERFEKDYSIKFNPNLTLDERRRQVINKMLSKKRLTKSELANFIRRNLDNGQYYITNISQEYRFEIKITDANYEKKLYDALFAARPCHLTFKIEVISYARRCGTFRCSQKTI